MPTFRVPLGALAAALACADGTGPRDRHVVPIWQIAVTSHAAPADTVWVSFVDGASACDVDVAVTQTRSAAGVSFTASSRPGGPCLILMGAGSSAKFPWRFALAPHSTPLTLRFTEPDGADSVRVVAP